MKQLSVIGALWVAMFVSAVPQVTHGQETREQLLESTLINRYKGILDKAIKDAYQCETVVYIRRMGEPNQFATRFEVKVRALTYHGPHNPPHDLVTVTIENNMYSAHVTNMQRVTNASDPEIKEQCQQERSKSHLHLNQSKDFWLHPQPFMMWARVVSVSPSRLVVQSPDTTGVEKSISLDAHTAVWVNGKLIAHPLAPTFNPNDIVVVFYGTADKEVIAHEVYGPVKQIKGRIIATQGHWIQVQELDAKSVSMPTGRVVYMQFDNRTYYDPGHSVADLQEGAIISTRVVGFDPGVHLIIGVNVLERNKSPLPKAK